MVALDPLLFRIELAQELAREAQQRVRQVIESRTLRRSLATRIDLTGKDVRAFVFVPQFWAVYYHDGRGPVRARKKLLVYFQNIEDDPRVSGGANYPTRATNVKTLRLSHQEFNRLRAEGKLILRKSVGPAPPHRFFDTLAGFDKVAAPVVERQFRDHVRGRLRGLLDVRASTTVRIF